MLKLVEYHPKAKAEMLESRRLYDSKANGLGLEFLLEVKYTESQIVQYPEICQIYETGTRRYIMKKFPFSVIYMVLETKIHIIAVAHCKRKSGYLKERLDNR